MSRFPQRIPIGQKRVKAPRKNQNLFSWDFFIWSCVILFLIVFAAFCWIASISIFSHPERPFSYSILKKLNKIESPKNFAVDEAPRGEFLNPDKILEKYASLSNSELESLNALLQRIYIRNYRLSPIIVPYITGEFIIMDSNELLPEHYFQSGIAVLATSKKQPNLILEYIFPLENKAVPILHRALLTGTKLTFSHRTDLSAILNIKKLDSGRLLVTTIPISYGSYTSDKIKGSVSLSPPSTLNVAAGLPVHNLEKVTEAQKKYSQFFEKNNSSSVATSEAYTIPFSQLIRVQSPIPAQNPQTPPQTQGAVESTPTTNPQILPPSSSPQVPIPHQNSLIPSATPDAPSEPNQLTSSPQPSPEPSPVFSSWKIYRSGMMPRGRLFEPKDLPQFAGTDFARENVYLRGRFIVTASGKNRAVLRSEPELAESLGLRSKVSNIRIIAEFPPGQRPPPEGSSFSRNAMRPFQIVRIQRSNDGQINIFVREITQPQ